MGIFLALTLLFGAVIAFMMYFDEPFEALLAVGTIFATVIGLFLYINLDTRYTLTADGLLDVRSGIFYHRRFDIGKIKSISESSNMISAPAPSLDRLELRYGQYDLIVVSPKDKSGFANELVKRNPYIENRVPQY